MEHIVDRHAVFPGSFDPFTSGHYDIVKRGLRLFDKITIAIGVNSSKKYLLPLEKRLEIIHELYIDQPKVHVMSFEGLTADFCRTHNAFYLLRGVRSSADFEFERTIAQLNHQLFQMLETVFLFSRPELSHVSSTIVREIILNGGEYQQFLPGDIEI